MALILDAHGDKQKTEKLGPGIYLTYYQGICLTQEDIADFYEGRQDLKAWSEAWAEEFIGPGLNIEDLAASLYEDDEEDDDKTALAEADAALDKLEAGPMDQLVATAGRIRSWEH